MRKFIVALVFLAGCLIGSNSFAEIVLEVTDCKDTVVQIQPESSGIGVGLGEGWIKYSWENIEKVVFTCDEKLNKDWAYPAEIILGDGSKNNVTVNYFYLNEKNEQGQYKDCYLKGKKDGGLFVLYSSKIKQIVVKKK